MNFIEKKYKAHDCFVDFINGVGTKEYQQFADLFNPMLFTENYHNLHINVGVQSNESFRPWLSTRLKFFTVIVNVFNGEPQLIIRNKNSLNVITINLALITNLHIKTMDNPNSYYHDIEFRYNNEVDYQMRVVINK